MPGVLMQLCIGRKSGLDGDRPAGVCVLVQCDKKMSTTHPLEGENTAILPTLLRRSQRELFVNLYERIDGIFEPKAVLILAVIAIKDARITFGCEDVRIGKNLVPDNRAADSSTIGIMIFDKRYCSLRVDPHKS